MVTAPVKWYGGKNFLAKRIIEHFPKHRIYLEPFGGAAAVLLKKQPSEIEIYNDLDLRITRLFRVLRTRGKVFQRTVELIPYSQVEFEATATYPKRATDVEKAICDYVRFRQSFGGLGKNWSYSRTVSHGGMAGQVHAWWTAIVALPEIIDRLKKVQITCQPACEFIKRFDHEDALIYCDPPYVHAARSGKNEYEHEMTDQDHRQLAQTLRKCKAKVVLSGYPSDLYDELYGDWRCVSFNVPVHVTQSKEKPRRTECLWLNY